MALIKRKNPYTLSSKLISPRNRLADKIPGKRLMAHATPKAAVWKLLRSFFKTK